jgi:hypothetical protein
MSRKPLKEIYPLASSKFPLAQGVSPRDPASREKAISVDDIGFFWHIAGSGRTKKLTLSRRGIACCCKANPDSTPECLTGINILIACIDINQTVGFG